MKILLRAFCINNFGDDLFVKIICDRYKHHEFYLICDEEYRSTFKDISNLKFVELSNFQKIKNSIYLNLNKIVSGIFPNSDQQLFKSKGFDLYLYAGGSIFMDTPGFNRVFRYEKRWFNNHPFVIGCNYGPSYSKKFDDKIRGLLKQCSSVVFRDKKSFDLFSDLENVKLSSDIAFNLKYKIVDEEKNVLISLMKVEDYFKNQQFIDNYYNFIERAVHHFLQDDYNVQLVSFCEKQGDLEACKRISSKFDSNKIEIIHYTEIGIDRMIQLFEKASFVVSTRFHAMVLAILMNKPFIPMVYNLKQRNVLFDLNYEGEIFDISKENKDISFDGLFERKYSQENVNQLIQLASIQFEDLDAILKE